MVSSLFDLNYTYLLDEFGEEKISKRYETIYCYLDDYRKRHHLEEDTVISLGLLNQMILDYFVDIYRLKDFHDINRVNATKIHAYSAYWLLKRRPIQIVNPDKTNPELVFVNERFVCGYLLRFLSESEWDIAILEERKQGYTDFIDNLMYFCQYRIHTPQMIETMLMGFQAGRALQFSSDYQNQ